MNEKDACDFVIVCGFLATAFQFYSLYDLITSSALSILDGMDVLRMILQTIFVLGFFASVTLMAYKLRDGLLTKERHDLEKPKPSALEKVKPKDLLLYGISITIGLLIFFFVMLVLPNL